MQPIPTEIVTRRYVALLKELREKHIVRAGGERGWMTAAAKRLGVSQAFVSQVWNGKKRVGEKGIQGAVDGLGLTWAYFSEAGDGDGPLPAERVERVGETLHAVELFLKAHGHEVSHRHALQLQDIRFGSSEPTVEMVRDLWRGMVARDAGKSAHRDMTPKIPDGDPIIDD